MIFCKSCYVQGLCAMNDECVSQRISNFTKERDEWQQSYVRLQEKHHDACKERDELQAKYDALQQGFEAFKNTAAETETFLRTQRDELEQRHRAIFGTMDTDTYVLSVQLYGCRNARDELQHQVHKLEKERDELQAQLEQQCTLEAIDAPATHVVNNYYGLDDARIRQMIRDEINRVFSRYGHSATNKYRS